LVQTSHEISFLPFIADSKLLIDERYAYFSVHSNSSTRQQSIVANNNAAQARPTPLKGVPNSCPCLLKESWFLFSLSRTVYIGYVMYPVI